MRHLRITSLALAMMALSLLAGCAYRLVTVDEFKALVSVEEETHYSYRRVTCVGAREDRYLFVVIYGMVQADRVALLRRDVIIEPAARIGELEALDLNDPKGGIAVGTAFGLPGWISAHSEETAEFARKEGSTVIVTTPEAMNGEVRYWLAVPVEDGIDLLPAK